MGYAGSRNTFCKSLPRSLAPFFVLGGTKDDYILWILSRRSTKKPATLFWRAVMWAGCRTQLLQTGLTRTCAKSAWHIVWQKRMTLRYQTSGIYPCLSISSVVGAVTISKLNKTQETSCCLCVEVCKTVPFFLFYPVTFHCNCVIMFQYTSLVSGSKVLCYPFGDFLYYPDGYDCCKRTA